MSLEASAVGPPRIFPCSHVIIRPWKSFIFAYIPLEVFGSIPPGEVRPPPCMDKKWNDVGAKHVLRILC